MEELLMSTDKQINANRKNAQKSTGPQTVEGKAAVSQNAVKHGLLAQSVIKGENEADYVAFHDKMVAEMKPVGPTEILLAERIVSLWWRLERAEHIQNQALDVMIARDEPSPLQKDLQKWMPKNIGPDTRGAGPELVLGRAIIKDYSDSKVLDRLMLYERRIENSLTKSTRELERRQIIRQYQQQQAEQEQSIPIPINNNRDEAATRIDVGEENGELKKQSQSVPGQNGATSYMKGDYDNNSPADDDENKANLSLREQSQLQRELQHVKRLRGRIATAIRACQ
jgi:hypothetical protein